MKRILQFGIASLAFGFITTAAFAAGAESFTFTSTLRNTNSVMVTEGMPKPVGAVFSTSESTAIYAGGQKMGSAASCAQWTLRPGSSDFDTNGVCTYTEKNGDVSAIIFGCINDTKSRQTDCWGGLQGVSGSRKGKSGTISWHSHPSPDGKSGMAAGTGQWND